MSIKVLQGFTNLNPNTNTASICTIIVREPILRVAITGGRDGCIQHEALFFPFSHRSLKIEVFIRQKEQGQYSSASLG